ITFALLVQFGSFLSEIDRNAEVPGGLLGVLLAHRRRLLDVLLDFVLITTAFAAAYFLQVNGGGDHWQRYIATVSLPAVLFARYATFIPFGLYRGVWRYAGARDAVSIVGAVIVSELAAFAFVAATSPYWGSFPKSVFVVD